MYKKVAFINPVNFFVEIMNQHKKIKMYKKVAFIYLLLVKLFYRDNELTQKIKMYKKVAFIYLQHVKLFYRAFLNTT